MPQNDSKQLSYSLVDYIEAIHTLTRLHGHAHTKDIAERLNVKMPSVTTALRQLKARGLINYNTHYPVELTPDGLKIAERIAKSHQTLEDFFLKAFALAPDTAHFVSSSIDHIVNDDIVKRFIILCNALEKRTDCKPLAVYLTEAMQLLNDHPGDTYAPATELPPGTRCVFACASKNLADAEERLVKLGLTPGKTVRIGTFSLDGSMLSLMTGDDAHRLDLPVAVAENLWMRELPETARNAT
ncbi:MAG: metal-dependent transcriptional regulator [Victivallales bacterium]|nr:metal-dependent transcriptional regulator [Victivallales bacterium]